MQGLVYANRKYEFVRDVVVQKSPESRFEELPLEDERIEHPTRVSVLNVDLRRCHDDKRTLNRSTATQSIQSCNDDIDMNCSLQECEDDEQGGSGTARPGDDSSRLIFTRKRPALFYPVCINERAW